MAIFAILLREERPAFKDTMTRVFPNAYYNVAPGQYIVTADEVTTQEIGEKLQINKGEHGQILIISVANYWGWHSNTLWEWLAAKAD